MGEAAQLKQRGNSWKISKSLEMSIRGNEVITNTAVRFQGQSEREAKGFRVEHWNLSLRNEGMDKHPKHQPFRARLINPTPLMRSERRVMSPHHSLLLYWFMFLWLQSADPKVTSNTHKHAHVRARARTSDDNAQGLTIRERWGTFSNVSSKCQLKITRVLEKVGSEGTDIFPFLTQQCLSERAAGWHDGIYFVSSLIHSDKAAPVNINERHPWANM